MPEIALHPAVAGVLFDALTEASEHVQVIASREIVKEKLYTIGELMRGNQLLPQASQEATPDA
jgi:hypothetical protein